MLGTQIRELKSRSWWCLKKPSSQGGWFQIHLWPAFPSGNTEGCARLDMGVWSKPCIPEHEAQGRASQWSSGSLVQSTLGQLGKGGGLCGPGEGQQERGWVLLSRKKGPATALWMGVRVWKVQGHQIACTMYPKEGSRNWPSAQRLFLLFPPFSHVPLLMEPLIPHVHPFLAGLPLPGSELSSWMAHQFFWTITWG